MSGPKSAAKPPPGQTGYAAFISYATEADRDTAFKLVEHLEAHGLKCWIAPRNVRAGKQYAEEIVRGIRTAQGFILVLSAASNTSKFVRREVEQADRRDKPIYALRIEEVDPSDALQLFLSEIHWIDAWKGELADHARSLAEMLREEEGPIEARSEPKVEARTPKPLKQAPRQERKPKNEAEQARPGAGLAAKWWLFALRGALAFATGAALIADGQYPATAASLGVTMSLLAVYLLTDGMLALASGIKWPGVYWRFAFIAEGLISLAGAAALLNVGYASPTSIAASIVAVGAARAIAALSLDAREGRWSLLASAAPLLGFAFMFAPLIRANPLDWGATYLTTCGLLLFAAGAGLLFVAFHLGARRRAQRTPDDQARTRTATAALARIWPAFSAAGLVLIAAGLPFLLWWLLPASPAWTQFGTPFAPLAAIGVGILLYGASAFIAGLRLDSASRLKLPLILYGVASILLGASSFADLLSDPLTDFMPSTSLFIEDPFDRFFGAWGLWAVVSGCLLLALAAAIDDGKFRLAGAAEAFLALGIFLLFAALDYTAQESMFVFWMGTVTIVAGVVHLLFASTLRTYEARPGLGQT